MLHKIISTIAKYVYHDTRKPFPTEPYRFTKSDARYVSNIILHKSLHHKFGMEVLSLEKEFAQYHGSKYALATNAGTSALEMAVKAIGINPGDEIIVPAYTFVATAQAVLARGGIPIFADIDDTFTISPQDLVKRITKKTKAIIPVHMFGNVADMDKILSIAKDHNLKVIEDCCQAVGATYKGRKVGTFGDIGCFSFTIHKAITTGQGGMLLTSQPRYFDIANDTRETGQLFESEASDVVTIGHTFALTEMQAALARIQLNQLDALNERRRLNYEYFVQNVDTSSQLFRWYRILPEATPSFSRFVFMVNFLKLHISRPDFISQLRKDDIPLKTFYPKPLYSYSLFRNKKDKYVSSGYPFTLAKTVNYRAMHLPFVETFCQQQVGLEFSPYIEERNILHLCRSLSRIIHKYEN
jgi:perosamine synthetase